MDGQISTPYFEGEPYCGRAFAEKAYLCWSSFALCRRRAWKRTTSQQTRHKRLKYCIINKQSANSIVYILLHYSSVCVSVCVCVSGGGTDPGCQDALEQTGPDLSAARQRALV